MAGPIEEGAKVAGGIIDALKAQPAVLALSLAQIAMLVFMFYALFKAAEFRDKMMSGQLDYQKHVSELLAKCIVPDKRTETDPAKPAALGPDYAKPGAVIDPPKPKPVTDGMGLEAR